MTWALLLIVTLLASVVQSATGFAFALIVVPAYLLLLGTTDVVQITIILSVVMSVAHLPKLKSNIPLPLLKCLAVGCAFGFPVGLYIYSHIDPAMLKILVAVFIIVISIQNGLNMLKKSPRKTGYNKSALTMTGALSGILGASLAMPGPLVMLYLSRTNLSKDEIRAIMISFFVFAYIAILILQAAVIGVERQTWITSAYLVPAALLGVFVGHQISKKINETVFKGLILIILIITGIMMLINL
jgi:uncharacterized protein|tara:strand:- start:242743 stop:243471 length:729 start_codon:yes stop_codon:yes gene_type:complete